MTDKTSSTPPPSSSGDDSSATSARPRTAAESTPFPTWPPQWPEIAESVATAIHSGDWGRYRGRATDELATRVADRCRVTHCRLVSSGSIGVELALRSVGVAPRDHVVLCGYDYPGNFRAIELLGARPILVDADPSSYSLDPAGLQKVNDPSVKAVLVSHLYGIPAQVELIREICDRNRWMLVEDACQVPEMEISSRAAGAWGDVGVLSFGGSKPLTAGNGGALLTNSDAIASKLRSWLDRPSDAAPISELQAAALLPQLDRLEHCNRVRWETYCGLVAQVGWLSDAVGTRVPATETTFYKFAFLSNQRDVTLEKLSKLGVPVGSGYRSMHRSSDRRCGKIGSLDQCRLLDQQVCLLDHSALLSTGDQRRRLVEAFTRLTA